MFNLRIARPEDTPVLQDLISLSGRVLSESFYTPDQAAAITEHVFGVDTQLLQDRTYFVIEEKATIVACGGWSRRRTLFGGDQMKTGVDPLLDPDSEAARIRAFFVHPDSARRGLGRILIRRCMTEARNAGFSAMELVSTAPGEPFYQACDFQVLERFELDLPGPIKVPVSRMWRRI